MLWPRLEFRASYKKLFDNIQEGNAIRMAVWIAKYTEVSDFAQIIHAEHGKLCKVGTIADVRLVAREVVIFNYYNHILQAQI